MRGPPLATCQFSRGEGCRATSGTLEFVSLTVWSVGTWSGWSLFEFGPSEWQTKSQAFGWPIHAMGSE